MRKIIVTEFLTLDGVMEEPQDWSFPYWTDEIGNSNTMNSLRAMRNFWGK